MSPDSPSRRSTGAQKRNRTRQGPVGRVRVIGGRWRGRRLDVIDSPGLRPSPDRLRETVFNWLAPRVPGARVLDLFAGSGSLGIEAASRGATSVTLVEKEAGVAARLRDNLAPLLEPGDDVTVLQSDWSAALHSGLPAADIIFVDPPFELGLHAAVLERLADGHLRTGGCVHLEFAVRQPVAVPPGYTELRSKRFGEVQATLLVQEV